MIFLLFPTQLFSDLRPLYNHVVYLIEEPRYFTDFKYHKLKLAYHRASMKAYYDILINEKQIKNVHYVEYDKVTKTYYNKLCLGQNVSIYDVVDNKLEKELMRSINNINIIKTQNFLIDDFEQIKKECFINNKFYHDKFYKYQRKTLDILMNRNNPIGNKWSFDTENRNAIPLSIDIPKVKINNSKYIDEAKEYIMNNFSYNYGSLDSFIYPITSKTSIKWLNTFLKTKLKNFGKYQDAVIDNEAFLFHSVISPMMNIGLITDREVVDISYRYYLKHKNEIPLSSFEGFIRQIIGWRNYVYFIYKIRGEEMRKENFLNHNNKINKKFWEAKTNIKPIDDIIKRIVKYSYAHHIERLMYLGNFMLLCQIKPGDVYKIFMEWTIDAYDWVMVPNVFGMSQYADGGKMMTRIYFSSSNYIIKMSNYSKNKSEWIKIWDALYYYFIYKHYKILKSNYATARQVKHWDNKSTGEKNELIKVAKQFIKTLLK